MAGHPVWPNSQTISVMMCMRARVITFALLRTLRRFLSVLSQRIRIVTKTILKKMFRRLGSTIDMVIGGLRRSQSTRKHSCTRSKAFHAMAFWSIQVQLAD